MKALRTGLLLAVLCGVALARAAAPSVVLISGEDEYESATTLPPLAVHLERQHGFKTTYLRRTSKPDAFPSLESLKRADLLILYARRMTLSEAQLREFQAYFDSGRPVVGLRTASHAFQNWLVFDKQVLGGNYQNHYGKNLLPEITVAPGAGGHPILQGVPARFTSAGSLYRNTPLQTNTTLLLTGTIPGHTEPVAWTHDYRGARIFYTSLGHQDDFKDAAFRRLLINGIYWALRRPVAGDAGATW